MPYIVLNDAACKQFKEKKDNTEYEAETEAPDIDWLNAGTSVQASENGRPIISRICGILSGDEEEQQPAAYISISSARELLQSNGQSTDYIKANVRITNIGHADSVS